METRQILAQVSASITIVKDFSCVLYCETLVFVGDKK